jgi:hypothetical protein
MVAGAATSGPLRVKRSAARAVHEQESLRRAALIPGVGPAMLAVEVRAAIYQLEEAAMG